MAKRRVWSALSNAYQTRLARGGITQEAYEAGVPLGKARGHGETPEHPGDVVRHPEKYKEYRKRASYWQKRVIGRKRDLFDEMVKYNEEHNIRNVRLGFAGQEIPVPGVELLKAVMKMSDDEFQDHARLQDDDDWRFLWYH